jgi:Ca-activated chloride channel family protein
VYKGLLGIFGPLVVALFCSCSGIQGKLLIMEGNFFNSRGMYTEAIGSYLKAQVHTSVRPYAEFGLGTVYFSLDEAGAALDRFAAAEQSLKELPKDRYSELLYRINYNTGVVRFKEGDYTGAAHAFRAALELDGGPIEAKRNLELSLLSLAQKKTAAPISQKRAQADEDPEDHAPLFEYVRQKEETQWKSREWIEDLPVSGPDY